MLRNGDPLFSNLPMILRKTLVVCEGFQPVPTCVPPSTFYQHEDKARNWRECLIYTCLGNQPATHRNAGSLAVNQQGSFCLLFFIDDPFSLFHNGAP